MIKQRAFILFGLLSLPLLHSGATHAAIVGPFTGGNTTQWTWDSLLVPLDTGVDTIVYNVHAFNFVIPFQGSGFLSFEDSDNFTLQLDITNLGTAFGFTEVSGSGSNDFGEGAGLDVQLIAEKTSGILSANGSLTTNPGSVFMTPWGEATLNYSLDISDVNVVPLGSNQFDIAFGDGIDVSLMVNSATTTFTMYGTGGFSVSVVPVPATFWLFGSGLLGLIGRSTKRRG
jgi:hypothetical protein